METQITYTQGRTARARMRGPLLLMTIPRHWPRSEQEAAIAKFKRWGQKQACILAARKPTTLPPAVSLSGFQTLVAQVNRETVNVPYADVRIGQARFTRLAQANTRTRVLTFSRFAIAGMPEKALRYLILHELCHLLVPNHSPAFWAQVGRYMPDYRQLRRVAQDHFRLASHWEASEVEEAEKAKAIESPSPVQLRLF